MSKLVIVESPTKAKTISKFLGKDYVVQSSFGHIRDLPKGKFGVDVEHDFAPSYVIPTKSRKNVTALKKAAAKADEIFYATDEDREGEAISWHLSQVLDVDPSKERRIVFHEITPEAIHKSLEHPRDIDQGLVDAQTARRILDRLVGYELSPFLWRKITKGLSAGRVQSVAVRLIVEREREIQGFQPREYWSIEAKLASKQSSLFTARLHAIDGETLDKFAIVDEKNARAIVEGLSGATFTVASVQKKQSKRSAPTPFTTSTLQQEANKRLHFSAKQTMMIAQQLYEGIALGGSAEGLITYMRTDSVNLAERFLEEAQIFVSRKWGKNYAAGKRTYTTKSKLAQEAHEAIRPTLASRTPQEVKHVLSEQQFKLYDLIWRRAIASQMPDAQFDATIIDSAATAHNGKVNLFRAAGQTLIFDGFLAAYPLDVKDTLLPSVEEGESLVCEKLEPLQHTTKPPARYSEAALVKALEEHGIGRPSTYAPTISTILQRNYVQREEGKLKPTDLAFMVNDLLVAHFPQIVDYEFTAHMEDSFDTIAEGKKEWMPIIKSFYGPFKELLVEKDKELTKDAVLAETTDEKCEKCRRAMVVRMSRYGKFLACSGFPECKFTKRTEDDNDQSTEEAPLCEKCGAAMQKKRGRFGSFWGCSNYPDCKNIKSLEKDSFGPCPECGTGTVTARRTKRGKVFYGCSRYPDCSYSTWTRPEKKDDQKQPGEIL